MISKLTINKKAIYGDLMNWILSIIIFLIALFGVYFLAKMLGFV